MSGYRTAEPAYCRGCGKPWTVGAQACPACGTELAMAGAVQSHVREALDIKRLVTVGSLIMVVSWVVSWQSRAADGSLWMAVAAAYAACAVAIVTAKLWRKPNAFVGVTFAVSPLHFIVAAGLGIALPALWGLLVLPKQDLVYLLTAEAELLEQGASMGLVALVLAGIAAEEVFFRGMLFGGVESYSGPRNAAAAAAILGGVMLFAPAYIALGILASILRLWTGSVAACVVFRWSAAVTWLGFLTTALM